MKGKYIIIKLVLLLVAAPLAIWFSVLSRTVHNCIEIRSLDRMVSATPVQENHLDLSFLKECDSMSDGGVIAEVENHCPRVLISSFNPSIEKEENGMSLVKAKIEMKGDYKSLLKALYYLENGGQYALSDMAFEKKEQRDKSVTLRVTLNQLVSNALE